MDGRERGFIVVHRRVRSSALYRSLTAEQRSVFYTLLLLANWKDGQMRVGEVAETVARGELAHSLATIAKEAKVSIKVVRTTISKLAVDDRAAGGRGPFLVERWIGSGPRVGTYPGTVTGTVPGTETGTGLRVLRVVNYDEYQSIIDGAGTDEGTETGTAEGTRGARQGHGRGTNRTKGTIVTKETSLPLAPATPPPGDPRFQPFVKAAFDTFADVKGTAEFDFDGHDGKRLKDFLSRQPKVTLDEFTARWRKALSMPRYPGCAKVAHLLERWNELAGAPVSPTQVTVPAANASDFQKGRYAL
jgi:hypothetical protein